MKEFRYLKYHIPLSEIREKLIAAISFLYLAMEIYFIEN